MKNQLFCLLFFLLCSALSFGQTKEIDSLKAELLKSKINDTTRIDILTTLTAKYISIDLDSFRLYTNKAWKLSLKNNNHRLSRIYSDKAIVKIMVDAEMDSARSYLEMALIELEKKEDLATRGAVYSNFAMSYQNSNEINKKIQYMLKAVDILEGDHSRLCISYYNIALTYNSANFKDLTIKYLKLALQSAYKSKNDMVIALSQRGLAKYEIDEKKFESAKLRLDESYNLCEQLKSPKVCLEINLEFSRLYEKLGEFDKSKKALLVALNFAEEYKDDYDLMSVLSQLARKELRNKNYSSSLEYFIQFNQIYKQRPEPQLGMHAFYHWAEVESKLGNHKNANVLLKKSSIIKDSVFSLENREALTNAEAKYQSEKKDKEIAEQKLVLADQKLSIQESKSKTLTMNILIISLLLGSILLWFSFRQRQKRMQQQLVTIEREQEVRTLESLMEGEEKERLRIAKELHDGVNGDLAAIKFKLASLLETNNQVINEAVAMIDTSSEQVRAISHNLVPPSLRDFDLLEAVATYCENINSIHEPEITFQHLGNAIVLNKKQEANLFRIVQELVTNSIKHAEAKEIHVQLSNVENNLQLTVEDDGKGFDENNVNGDGIGMQNVKSRVEYLNGLMDVKSDGKGTSITITISDKLDNA